MEGDMAGKKSNAAAHIPPPKLFCLKIYIPQELEFFIAFQTHLQCFFNTFAAYQIPPKFVNTIYNPSKH